MEWTGSGPAQRYGEEQRYEEEQRYGEEQRARDVAAHLEAADNACEGSCSAVGVECATALTLRWVVLRRGGQLVAGSIYTPRGVDHPGAPPGRIRLLGGFGIDLGNHSISLSGNEQRLIALLALRAPTSRDFLAGTLWPMVSESRAHGSLRTYLWRLRRAGIRVVVTDNEIVTLSPQIEVDLWTLTSWAYRVLEGRPEEQDLRPPDAVAAELLPGWYDEWVHCERERVHQLRLHALERLAENLGERGRYAAAIDAALRAIQLEPLRESPRRTLIALHCAEGNVCEATRHVKEFRNLIQMELGVNPSEQFVQLSRRLLEVNS